MSDKVNEDYAAGVTYEGVIRTMQRLQLQASERHVHDLLRLMRENYSNLPKAFEYRWHWSGTHAVDVCIDEIDTYRFTDKGEVIRL